jgi:diamine N-acetyltransferase
VWLGVAVTYQIRIATSEDAELLAALGQATYTQSFGATYPADDLAYFLATSYSVERTREWLSKPKARTWIASIAGNPVGFALAGPLDLPHPEARPEHGELKRLYLLQHAQGSGIGEALLQQALDFLDATQQLPIWLGVWSQNHGAQRLYARYGFTQVGTYHFIVGNTRDDELILRRPVDAP